MAYITHSLFFNVLFLLCFLPSCTSSHNEELESEPAETNLIYNIEDSTKIVRALIATNKIHEILEDSDAEQMEYVLNNFSPMEIAFEVEVLSCTLPVIVYFFNKKDLSYQNICASLETIVQQHDENIKAVIIDVEKFYTLAKRSEITETPTLAFVKDRNMIILAVDNFDDVNEIENAIEQELTVISD